MVKKGGHTLKIVGTFIVLFFVALLLLNTQVISNLFGESIGSLLFIAGIISSAGTIWISTKQKWVKKKNITTLSITMGANAMVIAFIFLVYFKDTAEKFASSLTLSMVLSLISTYILVELGDGK